MMGASAGWSDSIWPRMTFCASFSGEQVADTSLEVEEELLLG